jgi:hypothetical protein
MAIFLLHEFEFISLLPDFYLQIHRISFQLSIILVLIIYDLEYIPSQQITFGN